MLLYYNAEHGLLLCFVNIEKDKLCFDGRSIYMNIFVRENILIYFTLMPQQFKLLTLQ